MNRKVIGLSTPENTSTYIIQGHKVEYRGPGAEYFPEYMERARNLLKKLGQPVMSNRVTTLALALMIEDNVISVYTLEKKVVVKRDDRLLSSKSLRTRVYYWKKVIKALKESKAEEEKK